MTKKFNNYFDDLCQAKKINIEHVKPAHKIKINEPFNDVEIGLLNIAGLQREVTIKAVSKSMCNRIPTLENMKKNKNKAILKYFKIETYLNEVVECAVI